MRNSSVAGDKKIGCSPTVVSVKITGPGRRPPWLTPLELQTADRGAPRGVPTAAQGHCVPTHCNCRPVWLDLESLPRRPCAHTWHRVHVLLWPRSDVKTYSVS
jgi:hypothetical protein